MIHSDVPTPPSETSEEQLGKATAALTRAPVVQVALDSLVLGHSPRQVAQDISHVQVLADVPEQLPPVIVHRATMRVIDGVHRVHATRLLGRGDIAVKFFEGDADDAFLLAVRLNVRHGMPLSLAERRAAAERIITTHPSWSDRSVASVAGLSAKTVAAMRRRSTEETPQSNIRVGRDGRVRPLSAASGRLKASQILTSRPDVTLREVAAEAGISIGTAHDVRVRMEKGLDPVPAGRAREIRRPGEDRTASPPPPGGIGAIRSRHRLLSRDPALKYSTHGRRLLQVIGVTLLDEGDWSRALEAVPAHWLTTIAELANHCAEQWSRLAAEAENRSRRSA
ncbi:hypothetical protein [Streptomyces sp. NPDC048338]|uniref:ParB/RepB/Spo0J family partition protein n=1 Tax=Streptomyces sp. NPDC048338 TaxID=3365536 RepID=UPI0037134C61